MAEMTIINVRSKKFCFLIAIDGVNTVLQLYFSIIKSRNKELEYAPSLKMRLETFPASGVKSFFRAHVCGKRDAKTGSRRDSPPR